MSSPSLRVAAAIGLAILLVPPPLHAATATTLRSFESLEEPRVRFFPATASFERDDFVNITAPADGTFRFTLRYNPSPAWWDGDRDTTNRDRQRAEVKGLGPHQKHGETFTYATTWRTSPGYRATDRFCHVFQLKAIDGDNGAPLIVLSTVGENRAAVRYWPAREKNFIVVREFPWQPATWQSIRIRVKTTADASGAVLVSVDGDEFRGVTGVAVDRPQATVYRPKWGLYRGARPGMPLGDDFVEHRAVSAQREAAPAPSLSDATRAAEVDARLALLERDQDFPAALAWAERQPDPATQSDALLRILSRWSDADATAALAWLKTRAPAPSLDLALWFFTTDTTFRYVRRDLALEAAALIHTPVLRTAAFQHVLEIWARADRANALAFLKNSPALEPAQKITLAAHLQR